MLAYTVHEPPAAAADKLDRAELLEFVREGFSWSAALFGPFWLIGHRLWWALIGYVVVVAAGAGAIASLGLSDQVAGWWSILVHVLIGFEADNLRRWNLKNRGWQTVGVVTGRNALECERRFFDNWLPQQPFIRPDVLRDTAAFTGQSATLTTPKPVDRGGWWRSATRMSRRN